MPNAKDLGLSNHPSILVIGDSGTRKTAFLGTCREVGPVWIADPDNGMLTNRGLDLDYDTFKEAPEGVKVGKDGAMKLYPYGEAWPAFIKKLNEIGSMIDAGTCPYKVIGIDSLTTLTEICQTYVLKSSGKKQMEIQSWGAFLHNMRQVFSQLTGWPIMLVCTAHIRRMENDLTKLEEKLPMVPGQFAAMVSVYFDEVYYTDAKSDKGKMITKFITQPTSIIRQAKSRSNVPDGTEATWQAIAPFLTGSAALKVVK